MQVEKSKGLQYYFEKSLKINYSRHNASINNFKHSIKYVSLFPLKYYLSSGDKVHSKRALNTYRRLKY